MDEMKTDVPQSGANAGDKDEELYIIKESLKLLVDNNPGVYHYSDKVVDPEHHQVFKGNVLDVGGFYMIQEVSDIGDDASLLVIHDLETFEGRIPQKREYVKIRVYAGKAFAIHNELDNAEPQVPDFLIDEPAEDDAQNLV